MGEPVQLLKMKQYTLERVSVNGEEIQTSNIEQSSNTEPNGDANKPNGNANKPNGDTKVMYQNGYQGDKGYGDWDSAASPPNSPNSPTSPTYENMTTLPLSHSRVQPSSRPTSGSTRSRPKFIPEHEIDIPKDGSLYDFTADDMSTFLRYLGVEERIVSHVHKKGLDGMKFSKLKDSDLEALSMKNPIICHFRDKSVKDKGGKKKKLPFML